MTVKYNTTLPNPTAINTTQLDNGRRVVTGPRPYYILNNHLIQPNPSPKPSLISNLNRLKYRTYIVLHKNIYFSSSLFFLENYNYKFYQLTCRWLPITIPSYQNLIHNNYFIQWITSVGLPARSTEPLPMFFTKKHALDYRDSSKLRHGLKKQYLSSTGLFVIKNLNLYRSFRLKSYSYLYKLKKFTYSFSKPNQVKMSILKRKSTLILHKLLTYKDSYRTFLTNYTSTNLLKFFSNKVFRGSLAYNLPFYKSPNGTVRVQKSTLDIKPSNTPTAYTGEVRINRIRFKPGYQRIWRESREALKDLIGVKFFYQKQLTGYISRFLRKNPKNFLGEELTLSKILIYSRLIPDYGTFISFFRANMFFVNGKPPTSISLSCVTNDFIQLIVSKWYYVFSRWLINWSLIRSSKIKRLIYKKSLSSRYVVMKSRKQRSGLVPDWVFNNKYDFSDIKPYLEVDFLTLSFFVIYEPYTTYYYPSSKNFLPKTYIYKLYNWKYIT